jgi:hypothetical protein
MADTYKKLKNRLRGAKKKVKKLVTLETKSGKRVKKFGKKLKHAAVGTPQYRRNKRKFQYWRGVNHYARSQKAFWETIVKRRYRKKIAYERKHFNRYPTGFGVPDKPWNPYGRKVCGWITEEIDKVWAAGWRGVVVSGVRTPAESIGLCEAMCGAPSCAGRCAGATSNHNATTCEKYQGAIDVTDYYNFAYYARKAGSVLKNDLPIDRVHFSYTGH